MNKRCYDSEYISYIKNGHSAAVFITRDIVHSIDTAGMWIDVLDVDGEQKHVKNAKQAAYKWDFRWFDVELFPRKTKPQYPQNATEEDKKYITWRTAQDDIKMLRLEGYLGSKFRICPKLVNENRGRTRTVKNVIGKKQVTHRGNWNLKLQRYDMRMTYEDVYREVEVPMEPKWAYHIISVKKL